jgi:hypothetical protein
MFDHVKKSDTQGRHRRRAVARRALAMLACGCVLILPPAGAATATVTDECTPSDAWTETIPAQGEPTILVDNPDYEPAIPERSHEVQHPAKVEKVCHDAVTHQEYRYEIERPYWTVEHKNVSVTGLSTGQAKQVTDWLAQVGGRDLGGGWWEVPDAVIAAVNFNPVTVADTGTVGLQVYGGPNVTVSYKKSQEILSSAPTSGFGITQTSVRLFWNGTTWVANQSAAAWVTKAPAHGVKFDERTITDKAEWCEDVEVEPARTEIVVDQEAVPAKGEPKIEVDNPDYVPAKTIEHDAVVCVLDPDPEPEPTREPTTRPTVDTERKTSDQREKPAGDVPRVAEPTRPVVKVTG